MNRRLRKVHAGFALGLLVCVPLGFYAAIMSRPNEDLVQAQDMAWNALKQPPTTPIDQALGGPGVQGYGFSLRRGAQTPGSFIRITSNASGESPSPDVLAYYLEAQAVPQAKDALPTGVVLLGGLHGERRELFALPPSAAQDGGHILLYSLAHAELLGSASFNSWAH